MAVEIPVYVDIQGAFDRAVSEIPKEIPKLEKVLSNHALNMKIDMGGGAFNTVRNLLTDTTMSAKDLEFALTRVRKAFDNAVAKGAHQSRTSATVNNLAKAYGMLEQRIKGVYDANTVAAMRLEDTIAKVTFKVQDLKANLSTLTPGSDRFNKLNYEMMLQQRRLTELTKQHTLYKAGVDASNRSLLKQSSIIRQLTGYFSGLYAAHVVTRFVKQIRDVTGELEYQRVALGHLLQDVSYGNELFDRIVEAAKQSPFRITQLVTYTKQLAAYRIEQEELYDTTMRLADISAGLGVDMNRLILAYGQVRAASVLRGQELRQFTEAGIPLVEELSKKFTKLKGELVSTADVFKLISERAVPFEYIKEIFEELTDAGGMFYKMQEEQAKTLKGRWEKLKDAYDQALMRLGDSSTFQNWNDTVLKILNGVAKNLTGIVRVVNAATIGWVTYKIATGNVAKSTVALIRANAKATASMIKMFGVAGTLRAGIVALRQAWHRFMVALSQNWVGIALTAISTLVTYFTTFRKKTKDAAEGLNDMEKAIERMKDANKEFAYGNELIANYEELAKKTNRTSKESERMLDTLNELERAFPNLTSKIDDDNLSLEERLGIMRDVVQASHDMAVEEAKNRLNTQKEVIRGLEDDAEAAKLEKEAAQRRLEAAQTAEKTGSTTYGMYGQQFAASAEELKNNTIEAANAAKAAAANYDEAANKLAEARNEAEKLEELIDPKKTQKEWEEWQNQIKKLQDSMMDVGDTPVFTDEQIGKFTSVFDLSGKLEKKMKDLTVSIAGMKALYDAMGDKQTSAAESLNKDIERREKELSIAQAIKDLLKLTFGKKGTTSYTQDPFIKQMEERMKFMKDFQKGYEDLQKYISSSDALSDVSEKMKARGLSLGINVEDQAQAAKDLSRWYSDAMDDVFEQAKKHGATGTIESFLSQQISDTTNRGKALRDFQKLLQSLFDAKTDLDVSKVKKDLEDELKRVSDEIKRSETARNFFQNILDLTGDEQLAATMGISVYGDIGSEFKDRLQSQLDTALRKLDASDVTDELRSAIASQDFSVIFKYLDKFPEEWQKRLKQMAEDSEKFNADRVQNLLKALQSAKTYGDKRVELAKQTAKRTAEIEEMNISDSDKKNLLTKNMRKEAEEAAKLQYEAFKDTPMYVELFADLDAASSRMLRNMQAQLESMKDNWKDLHPRELKELQSRLSEIDKQLASRNPFKAMSDSIQEYNRLRKTLTRKDAENQSIEADRAMQVEKEMLDVYTQQYEEMKRLYGEEDQRTKSAKISMEIQRDLTDKSIEQAEAAQNTANQYRNVRQHIYDAAVELKKWSGYLDESLSAIGDIVDVFGSDDTSETFKILSEGISKTASGAASLAAGIATGNPIDIVKGVSSIVTGVAETIQKLRFKKIDKELERQQRLIDELEYSYGRLEKAMEQSFGSEYIYNYTQQLENLVAKQKAYEEQARLEREKGKKADEDKIKDYENAARDAADQISDMRSQLSEFFSGTDLASAAQDFADAWIDAYKEFSSTTDAMSEKFNDMIESMINRSLAAKIMQEMLSPIFSQIDELSKDGLLSTEDIASIAALAQERIPLINDAMTNLMTSLASAGYDVKTQTAGLKGISKDIAGASEESILGLAAAVNTQNFYISYVPVISENVAQILSAMTGGASPTSATATTENGDIIPSVQQMVYDHLPSMDQNMAEMLRLLRSVVTTKNASTNTAYIAVK